jgi:hypothetical protein
MNPTSPYRCQYCGGSCRDNGQLHRLCELAIITIQPSDNIKTAFCPGYDMCKNPNKKDKYAAVDDPAKPDKPIRSVYYDPMKDAYVFEFINGMIHQISTAVLQGEEYCELRNWINQQMIAATRIPEGKLMPSGHLYQDYALMPRSAPPPPRPALPPRPKRLIKI